MHKLSFLPLILALFLLIGCNDINNQKEQKPINVTQISSKQVFNQQFSNEAKQLLSKKETIERVLAVNTDELLIIAIEIPHHERFQLTKINKELSKEMDEYFKDKKITVELATDKKIMLELEKLENKLIKNNITKKQLEKELKHLSKLLKEQT